MHAKSHDQTLVRNQTIGAPLKMRIRACNQRSVISLQSEI